MIHIGKIIVISFEDGDEALERVLSVLTNEVHFEPVRAITSSVLQYPGLEIRLAQRKVLRDGEEVSLTRHEYGILIYLTTYPGQVFSKQQIYEAI